MANPKYRIPKKLPNTNCGICGQQVDRVGNPGRAGYYTCFDCKVKRQNEYVKTHPRKR